MFSARTAWDRTENPLAIAIEDAKAEGRPLVDLTESNPTRVGLFDLTTCVAELGHPRGGLYEPAPLGHREGRGAVASYYAARGLRADPERVVLSASTSEAYSWIFTLLCDPEDAILVPRPSYPLLSWIAQNQRVHLVPYPLRREAHFRVDLGALEGSIDRRTRAIVLIHPNNPTGSFIRKDEAEALCELAREHDLALIVDEVFGDYALAPLPNDVLPSFVDISPDVAPLTFVLSGLSKVLLLPQCKLAWTVVSGPDALVAEALARLEFVADTFLSVSTPVQLALAPLLERRPAIARAVRERLVSNLATLDRALSNLGPASPVRRLPMLGGWYAILEVPRIHDEDRWVELLVREEGVIVHPGYFFDFDRDGFLVVSLLQPPGPFGEAVERLTRRLLVG